MLNFSEEFKLYIVDSNKKVEFTDSSPNLRLSALQFARGLLSQQAHIWLLISYLSLYIYNHFIYTTSICLRHRKSTSTLLLTEQLTLGPICLAAS